MKIDARSILFILLILPLFLAILNPVFAAEEPKLDFSENLGNAFENIKGGDGSGEGSAVSVLMGAIDSVLGETGLDFIFTAALVTAVMWFLFGLIGNKKGDSDFWQKISLPISLIIGIGTAFYTYSKGISLVGFIGPYGILAIIGFTVFVVVKSGVILSNKNLSIPTKTMFIGVSIIVVGVASMSMGIFVSGSLLALLVGIGLIIFGIVGMVLGRKKDINIFGGDSSSSELRNDGDDGEDVDKLFEENEDDSEDSEKNAKITSRKNRRSSKKDLKHLQKEFDKLAQARNILEEERPDFYDVVKILRKVDIDKRLPYLKKENARITKTASEFKEEYESGQNFAKLLSAEGSECFKDWIMDFVEKELPSDLKKKQKANDGKKHPIFKILLSKNKDVSQKRDNYLEELREKYASALNMSSIKKYLEHYKRLIEIQNYIQREIVNSNSKINSILSTLSTPYSNLEEYNKIKENAKSHLDNLYDDLNQVLNYKRSVLSSAEAIQSGIKSHHKAREAMYSARKEIVSNIADFLKDKLSKELESKEKEKEAVEKKDISNLNKKEKKDLKESGVDVKNINHIPPPVGGDVDINSFQ